MLPDASDVILFPREYEVEPRFIAHSYSPAEFSFETKISPEPVDVKFATPTGSGSKSTVPQKSPVEYVLPFRSDVISKTLSVDVPPIDFAQ